MTGDACDLLPFNRRRAIHILTEAGDERVSLDRLTRARTVHLGVGVASRGDALGPGI